MKNWVHGVTSNVDKGFNKHIEELNEHSMRNYKKPLSPTAIVANFILWISNDPKIHKWTIHTPRLSDSRIRISAHDITGNPIISEMITMNRLNLTEEHIVEITVNLLEEELRFVANITPMLTFKAIEYMKEEANRLITGINSRDPLAYIPSDESELRKWVNMQVSDFIADNEEQN